VALDVINLGRIDAILVWWQILNAMGVQFAFPAVQALC
jgi:hypothetical protein